VITNTPESTSPELSDASETIDAEEKARSAKLIKSLIGGSIRSIFSEFYEGFIEKGEFTEEEIIELAIEQMKETMEEVK
jgi:hypothetical protein